MKTLTQTTRSITRAIVLVLAVAAIAVPAAQANHQYGDAVDRHAASLSPAGGYLDAVDRYILNNAPPDAVDRLLRNHEPEIVVGGALDEIELVRGEARGATANRSYDAVELVRSQPTETSAQVAVAAEPGFDWADAGIGAGVAFAAMLLAAAAVLAARGRGRVAHS